MKWRKINRNKIKQNCPACFVTGALTRSETSFLSVPLLVSDCRGAAFKSVFKSPLFPQGLPCRQTAPRTAGRGGPRRSLGCLPLEGGHGEGSALVPPRTRTSRAGAPSPPFPSFPFPSPGRSASRPSRCIPVGTRGFGGAGIPLRYPRRPWILFFFFFF